MNPDRPPRSTHDARQPHLSEQAGEGRKLSWAGDHRQVRYSPGGRACRAAEDTAR